MKERVGCRICGHEGWKVYGVCLQGVEMCSVHIEDILVQVCEKTVPNQDVLHGCGCTDLPLTGPAENNPLEQRDFSHQSKQHPVSKCNPESKGKTKMLYINR